MNKLFVLVVVLAAVGAGCGDRQQPSSNSDPTLTDRLIRDTNEAAQATAETAKNIAEKVIGEAKDTSGVRKDSPHDGGSH